MQTLMIMTSGFQLLGELPLFNSLQLTRSYWGIGDFELHTSPSAPCAQYLTQGALLFSPDAPHKMLVIEDRTENAKELVVQGCQLKGWVRRRICVPPLSLPTVLWRYTSGSWVQITDPATIRTAMAGDVYQGYAFPTAPAAGMYYLDLSSQAAVYDWASTAETGAVWLDLETAQLRSKYKNFGWDRYTGPAESALKHYALNNMISPEDIKRKLPGLVCAADQERGLSLPWQARFDKLDDMLTTIGEATGMGWDIRPDFVNHQFVFDALVGRDLSQGSRIAVISGDMGNADDVELKQILSGSATTAYTGGAGEDENRLILAIGDAQGLDRRETWVEAGSVEDPALLTLLGENKINDAAPKTTLTAKLIDTGACRYERDWDLGDVVLVRGVGASTASRIIEVKEVYEAEKPRQLEVTFGTSAVTIGKIIRRIQGETIR